MAGEPAGNGDAQGAENVPYLKGPAAFYQIHAFGKSGKLPEGGIGKPGKEEGMLIGGAASRRVGAEQEPVIPGKVQVREKHPCPDKQGAIQQKK
jgi:hypothetical protein